jgi:hypothetical protein
MNIMLPVHLQFISKKDSSLFLPIVKISQRFELGLFVSQRLELGLFVSQHLGLGLFERPIL